MRLMRLVPIYQAPNTRKKHPQHKIYPYLYLLRGLTIDRPNQVWCVDITYIPMRPYAALCGAVFCIWSRSWIGSAVKFLVGICQTAWRLTFALPADCFAIACRQWLKP